MKKPTGMSRVGPGFGADNKESPSEILTFSFSSKLPPPGLYGPFATGDFAFWNGDFTLDCKPSHALSYGLRCNHTR